MAQFPNIFNCDLHSGPVSASIRQMYLGDIAANRVGVRVTDNGEAVALSGTCSGTAMLYNGGTVALTGVVDGNVAYVDLPAAVYSVEGPLKIFVTLTHGGSTTTLLEMRSNVTRTDSGVVIDPGTIIPSVAALISDIEDAVASIPEDYSELSADVVQLKSDMAEVKPEVETLGEDVSSLKSAVNANVNGIAGTFANGSNMPFIAEWEYGSISANGENQYGTDDGGDVRQYYARTKDYYIPNETIKINSVWKVNGYYSVFCARWDAVTGTFVDRTTLNDTNNHNATITLSPDYKYRFSFTSPNTGTVDLDNIMDYVVLSFVPLFMTTRNAAYFGVLPENDASTNTTNLQTLLDQTGTIIIDKPGTYLFESGLKIGSNTSLIFGNYVYCKRADDLYKSFLINKGAFTKQQDYNITIDGLSLICDGHYGTWQGTIHGLRGHLSFYYVSNLTLRNIRCSDLPEHTYFIHMSNWDTVRIDNIRVAGNKDAIHCNRGKNLHVTRGWFQTNDDPIGLNAIDYVDGCPEVGPISDVIVEDCIDESTKGTGYISRMLSGAWLDWAYGNEYRHGDVIVTSDKNIYRMIKDPSAIELMESTVEPTHTSGDVTESDGIKWRYIQSGELYYANHKNITFRDIYLKAARSAPFFVASNNDSYMRAFYPGTVPPRSENIRIENVCVQASIVNLIRVQTPVDFISLDDANIACDCVYYFEKSGDYIFNSSNNETYVSIDNSIVKPRSGNSLPLITNTASSRNIKANIHDNYKNGTYTGSIAEGVTIINNDLA